MHRYLILIITAMISLSAKSQTYVEHLTRGGVAVQCKKGNFISWRFLPDDTKHATFDVLRDGKIIASRLDHTTSYLDTLGTSSSVYNVVAHLLGTTEKSVDIHPWNGPFMSVPISRPADNVFPGVSQFTYSPNDCSVGDVDGDGEYELFLKWDPSNSHDNAYSGYTGNVFIDCYKIDYSDPSKNTGKYLWRIDLGRNIRAGAHYTQFMVYDFDGDGKAEMMCKTAPGSIDGKGKFVSKAATDKEIKKADNKRTYSYTNGRNLGGPEYLTVFSGEDGHAIHTVFYNPNRAFGVGGAPEYDGEGWGDRNQLQGNRGDRFLACVAFLGGKNENPSGVFCRGYYTRAYLWAVDFDGKHLSTRWLHKSEKPGEGVYGQGAHSVSVGDIDGDGFDEIMYGGGAIDHDGRCIYSTGLGHGDAQHLGDFVPDRPGLEYYMVHEKKPFGCSLREAATGQMLFRKTAFKDTGRGLCADIDPYHRGAEYWNSASKVLRDEHGEEIATAKSNIPQNFRIYWDGDLQDELIANSVLKVKPGEEGIHTVPYAYYIAKWIGDHTIRVKINGKDFNQYDYSAPCNGTKATPCLQADLFGDWREEVILYNYADREHLNIFSTNYPTKYRVPTLMSDHVYRMGIAWQNCCYNQPPHLGYYLPDLFGEDLK